MEQRTDTAEPAEPDTGNIPESHIDQDELEKPGVVDQMYGGWLDRLFEKDIDQKRASADE